jgi:hypothetical protein
VDAKPKKFMDSLQKCPILEVTEINMEIHTGTKVKLWTMYQKVGGH